MVESQCFHVFQSDPASLVIVQILIQRTIYLHHKKIAMMEYVVPLEEKQQGVAHRAARYYKFDKKIYNKVRR